MRIVLRWVIVGLCLAGTAAPAPAVGMTAAQLSLDRQSDSDRLLGVQARAARAFTASMGIGTHLSYPGAYRNTEMIERRLLQSGVRRIRASWSPEDAASQALAVRLGRQGIKVMFWTGQIGSDLQKVKRAIKQTNALAPGTIDSIEGPNEQDGNRNLRAFVKQYHDVLASDPATANLRIYGPSMANVNSSRPYEALGDISQWVDAANVHDYPGGRMMTDALITAVYGYTRNNVGSGGRVIASELGYSNATGAKKQPHPAVPPGVAAVLVPRLYLEHFRRGIEETYVYELVDEAGQTPWESGFGLLDDDFSPKPAFRAISNLAALLDDPGPGFTPGRLRYSLTGTDANTRSLLLQKRDGSYWLALWQQTDVWDRDTKRPIDARSLRVGMTLQDRARITTYSPLTGTAPQTSVTSAGTALVVGPAITLVRISA